MPKYVATVTDPDPAKNVAVVIEAADMPAAKLAAAGQVKLKPSQDIEVREFDPELDQELDVPVPVLEERKK